MARNDTRTTRTELGDRARLRTGASAWSAFAHAAVATTLVVAVVVGVLSLVDALLWRSPSALAQRPAAPAPSHTRHAGGQRPQQFSTACAWRDAAACATD